MYEFHTRRRIEFSDTDMAGVVHFARFFIFMETAEHQMLAELGVRPGSYRDESGRAFAWPRVTASCDYLAPARYGDELDIRVTIERLGRSSLTYGFDLACGPVRVAQGKITAVCCTLEEGGVMAPVPLPEALVERLRQPLVR
jgi:acyl-CoA thioester hydrolase